MTVLGGLPLGFPLFIQEDCDEVFKRARFYSRHYRSAQLGALGIFPIRFRSLALSRQYDMDESLYLCHHWFGRSLVTAVNSAL